VTRIVCYTAIFGGFNVLNPHPWNPDIDWVAFVDEESVPRTPTNWDLRIIPCVPGVSPRMAAKRFKLLPSTCLSSYNKSVWVDGTISIDSPTFPEEALDWTAGSGVAMFRHPERTDIWDEADVSLTMPKYQAEPIALQVDHYLDQGFPRYAGLWCGGIIARENTELVRKFGEAWLSEVDRWSIQDQISLPFGLRKLGITPGAFPGSLYSNPWLSITGHNPER
jgi:hypothetical protein